jgi:hypothetical protein
MGEGWANPISLFGVNCNSIDPFGEQILNDYQYDGTPGKFRFNNDMGGAISLSNADKIDVAALTDIPLGLDVPGTRLVVPNLTGSSMVNNGGCDAFYSCFSGGS